MGVGTGMGMGVGRGTVVRCWGTSVGPLAATCDATNANAVGRRRGEALSHCSAVVETIAQGCPWGTKRKRVRNANGNEC